jgi:hypothetical protein
MRTGAVALEREGNHARYLIEMVTTNAQNAIDATPIDVVRVTSRP